MSSQRVLTDLRRLGGRLLRRGARRSFAAPATKTRGPQLVLRSSSRHPLLVLGAPMRRSSRRNLRPDI